MANNSLVNELNFSNRIIFHRKNNRYCSGENSIIFYIFNRQGGSVFSLSLSAENILPVWLYDWLSSFNNIEVTKNSLFIIRNFSYLLCKKSHVKSLLNLKFKFNGTVQYLLDLKKNVVSKTFKNTYTLHKKEKVA